MIVLVKLPLLYYSFSLASQAPEGGELAEALTSLVWIRDSVAFQLHFINPQNAIVDFRIFDLDP